MRCFHCRRITCTDMRRVVRFFEARRPAISQARSISLSRGTTSLTSPYWSAFCASIGSHIHMA
jgi:hypothetical protein